MPHEEMPDGGEVYESEESEKFRTKKKERNYRERPHGNYHETGNGSGASLYKISKKRQRHCYRRSVGEGGNSEKTNADKRKSPAVRLGKQKIN